MRKAIEEIIRDFQSSAPVKLSIRELKIPKLPAGLNKPFVFIGMRRTGKTYLLLQIIQELQVEGIDKDRIIYINFEDERLADLSADKLRLILDCHTEIYPEKSKKRRFLFLDEVQIVKHWEKFVRRLIDNEDMQIYLTGSSSKLLGSEVAASLRGRSLTFEVMPFSFREYLSYRNVDYSGILNSKLIGLIKNIFSDYLVNGGFPETINMEEQLRLQTLQEYITVAVHRDIVERHQLKNPDALKALIKYLLENSASLFSIHKAYNLFKSQGRSVSKDSMYKFIDHIHDAFLLFPVELFSPSKNKRMANPKKMYALDTGLMTAFSWKYSRNIGALLENCVYAELRRRSARINYYKTQTGKEVDFICQNQKGEITLIQVAAEINSPPTLDREKRALQEAMDELNIAESFLITLNDDDKIQYGKKTINILPAYRWFLLRD